MDVKVFENVVGFYQEDGSVKCRNCMSEKDWKHLEEEKIITVEDLERDNEWIFCDYCEDRLEAT